MEILSKYVNHMGAFILVAIIILYNIKSEGDVIYCGIITGIDVVKIKSVETKFLIVNINNGITLKIAGSKYYQTIGKPIEIIESTNMLGTKSYKVNNVGARSGEQLKPVC